MEKITSKKGMKRIVIAIVIVLLFNFAMPTYSQAGLGGTLAGPIIDFVAAICDVVLSALQYFMYDGGASTTTGFNATNIFSSFLLSADAIKKDPSLLEQNGIAAEDAPEDGTDDSAGAVITIDSDEFDKGWRAILSFGLLEKDYSIPVIKYTPEAIFGNRVPALDVNFINPTDWTDEYGDDVGGEMNKRSITQDLHEIIANWYVALRNLAIIALLSVLIYVGIRMVISSTASDKAKYKQMFFDWVVALCIVFFLHYIMSFILTLTEMITEGIGDGSAITVQIPNDNITFKTDLTGLCRLQIQYEDLGARLIYLIFYIALTIYTVMFTWTYVKRAITMAFLTLMAPLVAITYPIDKINDGKSQAFNIWLREFIFNALLQPFHLIIYTIFLGSSMEIAIKNPIYAILFLAFIIPSEKLLRKMFGFDKSNTAGGMSTAASLLGGAAVMKGARSLIGKAGKSGGSSGSKGIRTKNPVTSSNTPKLKDAFADSNNAGSGNSAGNQPVRTANTGTTGSSRRPTTANSGNSGGVILGSGAGGLTGNGSEYMTSGGVILPSMPEEPTAPSQISQTPQGARLEQQNAWQLQRDENGRLNDNRGLGEYLRGGLSQTTGNIRQNVRENFDQTRLGQWAAGDTRGARVVRTIKNAPKTLKGLYNSKNPYMNTIRGAVGTVGHAAASTAKFAAKAAVGGTLGLAAGIAGDDLEDVATYGLAGAALGVTGLPALGRGMTSGANSLRSTYETKAFGAEEAALRQQGRELMKDDAWNEAMDKGYEDIYGAKPTAKQSKEFKKSAIDYYNSGITDTKDITKSMKFEKELKEQMIADGATDIEAEDRAKKQAIVISKLANETKYEELTNTGKRNDLKSRFVKEFKAGGMSDSAAVTNADSTINLIMKRKGLSPE